MGLEMLVSNMPEELTEMLSARLAKRKNRHWAMWLARWMVWRGYVYRTTKGFHLVKGDYDREGGLKEDPILRALEFTIDTIRGAIKTLREIGFLDARPDMSLLTPARTRRLPLLYRIAKEFGDAFRRGRKRNPPKWESQSKPVISGEEGKKATGVMDAFLDRIMSEIRACRRSACGGEDLPAVPRGDGAGINAPIVEGGSAAPVTLGAVQSQFEVAHSSFDAGPAVPQVSINANTLCGSPQNLHRAGGG